jgi:TatD DNase family protein
MFIDTHCHLDFPPFMHEMSQTIANAQQANVKALIVPTVSAAHFDSVIHLANQHAAIYAALGLHPIYQHQQHDIDKLEYQLKQHPHRVIAIGEIGLDRFVNTPTIEEQTIFFNAQLTLAKKYQLPVMLHSRRAHDLLYTALKKARLPQVGVIHGFSGSFEQAMQFIRLGYFIGVGGTITYPRANKTRQAIKRLPLTSLVLETDAPDMPLFGYQGQINRPERIVQIFETLCQLRNESKETICNQIITNTKTLFPMLFSS